MRKMLSPLALLLLMTSCAQDMESPNLKSPTISSIVWGKTIIEYPDGKTQEFKDVRLWPDNAQAWNWAKTGTRHKPGTQIADFQDFFDTIDVLVLSQGMDELLQIHPDTIEFLKKSGKEFHIAQTEKAVEIYNRLAQSGKKVGALIHSTC